MCQINQLFNKFLKNECSAEEVRALFEHFNEAKDEASLKQLVADAFDKITDQEGGEDLPEEKVVEMYSKIHQRINKPNRVYRFFPKLAIAASLLIFMSIGGYLFLEKKQSQQNDLTVSQSLSPGGSKAILTLANGKKVVLEEAGNGLIANEGSTEINKTGEGQLVYHVNSSNKSNDSKYNEITIPRGGEFKIVLPDGTKVWLNSSSSLKYPSRFTGNTRNVELIGEGYFEVAKNTEQPFIVKVRDMQVQVLGTQFNLSAYKDDDSVITTLLEGSVNVKGVKESSLLKPGEQSFYSGNSIKVAKADVEEAVAWKNGYFRFNNESIESIMKKVSRWYNVEVEYQGDVKDKKFWGTFSRNKNIAELLANLELTESIKFKIEGRRVTVMR